MNEKMKCGFCDSYSTLRSIYKWRKTETKYIRHYFRSALVVKTFDDKGLCGKYVTKTMKLKYCPECGRKLNDS